MRSGRNLGLILENKRLAVSRAELKSNNNMMYVCMYVLRGHEKGFDVFLQMHGGLFLARLKIEMSWKGT
jgi:hypothetical protein